MVSSILYRLVAFADYSNLNYDSTVLSVLENLFRDQYSITPSPEPSLTGNPYIGLNLSSNDEDLPIISIGSMRIEIAMPSKKKTGFDEKDLECAKNKMVSSLISIYGCFKSRIQDAYRLAWISNYAYFEIGNKEMSDFRNRYLKPLRYYDDKSTNEFVAKYAGMDSKTINGSEEKLNVLSTIYRWFPSQGTGSVTIVDGYGLELDINTVSENKKNRFSSHSFGEFVSFADAIKNEIVGEVFNGCF